MKNSKETLVRFVTSTCLLATISTASILVHAGPSAWTMRNDNSRSSTNLAERLLTTSNVNTATFGKLFTLASDDQIYTTPLYISDVNIGGQVRNAVFFASVNNSVYAYDSDTGALLWRKI